MIIHVSGQATKQQYDAVIEKITRAGLSHEILHSTTGLSLVGVVGDTGRLEESYFAELDGVEKVVRISKPYKLVSREYSPASKQVMAGDVAVGGKELVFMAGPCSCESEQQIRTIADYCHGLHIPVLRAGAYKPRTSPYSFQGMGLRGLQFLAEVREQYQCKIVTEATGLHRHIGPNGKPEKKRVLDYVVEYADIIQVGARNMKSYGFLQELAVMTRDNPKPILLKRGDSSTIKEFLLAAEYLVANGNPNVILCLRGIRTFEEERFQRFTPDIGAIAVLKRESNLPVLFDPSHSAGYRHSVHAVSLAAAAAGADGLLIETHNDPANALCDGEQSVTREQLAAIIRDAATIRNIVAG